MKQATYKLRKRHHISYEIEVIEGGKQVQYIPTIFTEEKYAKELVHICNENKVEPVHVLNIMDDMIYDIEANQCK